MCCLVLLAAAAACYAQEQPEGAQLQQPVPEQVMQPALTEAVQQQQHVTEQQRVEQQQPVLQQPVSEHPEPQGQAGLPSIFTEVPPIAAHGDPSLDALH